jgi:hypothetical protein
LLGEVEETLIARRVSLGQETGWLGDNQEMVVFVENLQGHVRR